MDTDLRVSIIAAAAAALLSALIGIIAGVGFGTLLLRALAGGALFGALVYGGFLVAARFLPTQGGSAQAPAAEGESHTVDIVLPGEAPDGFSDGRRADDADDFGKPLDALARAESGGSPLRSDSGGDADSGLEEIEGPNQEEDGAVAAVPRASAAGGTAFEDLDVLPDLDGFSETFAGTEFSGTTEPSESALPRRADSHFPGGARGGSGSDTADPASLAQAVRTILKRDKKG